MILWGVLGGWFMTGFQVKQVPKRFHTFSRPTLLVVEIITAPKMKSIQGNHLEPRKKTTMCKWSAINWMMSQIFTLEMLGKHQTSITIHSKKLSLDFRCSRQGLKVRQTWFHGWDLADSSGEFDLEMGCSGKKRLTQPWKQAITWLSTFGDYIFNRKHIQKLNFYFMVQNGWVGNKLRSTIFLENSRCYMRISINLKPLNSRNPVA